MRGRTFLIIIILVPLLVIGLLALYNRGKKKVEEPPPPDEQEAGLPPASRGGQLVVDLPVVSPVLSFDADTVWFASLGRLYRQSLEAGATPEEYPLPEGIDNLVKIVWQQRGSDFITVQNIAGHVRYRLFDADNARFLAYPEQAREVTFMASETEVVYTWVRADGGYELKVADIDGQNFRKVMDLPRADYLIAASAVKNEAVLFADNAVDPAGMLLVDLDTGSARTLAAKGAISGAKFSPDGRRLLVARGNVLVVIDIATAEVTETGIAAAVDSAAWMPTSGVFVSANSQGLVRFNLETRSAEVLWPQTNLQIREAVTHPEAPVLFYVDAASGKLYRIEL